ncbi:MAG: response regulator [Candidatus Omnitrophica bacterium]|nr:response regulator [Candidatus Omnitrophota bacterium]
MDEKNVTILFIDDNKDFLNLTEEELESAYYEIKTLLVGVMSENMIDQIKAAKPDLIFLDVMFSKKFSNSLASAVRNDTQLKAVPIYLMSFLDIDEIMAIANKEEVNGAFMKPIKREDIQSLFKKHFDLDIDIEED